MLAFLAVTFATTWLPAWLLRDLWRVEGLPLAWRILACSILYLSVIGWQPVVAVLVVRRYLEPPLAMDAGLRPSSGRFVLLGMVVPALAMLGASLLALALGHDAERFQTQALAAPQGNQLWSSILAIALVLSASAIIYGQCLIEEVAWRGYFLVRAMECAGPWRGLLVHGLVWGIWYAPVLLLTTGGSGSWLSAAEFVVTCVLLGVLLGWLRLASRSIIPAVAANVVLTLGAGLPILLSGSDVGARSAVYLPVGWVPLLLIACWLAFSRHKHAVVTPRPPRRVLSEALH